MQLTDLHSVNPYEKFDETQFALDIRGWNFDDPIFESLILETNPQLIVEVGSWLGGSAIKMADAIKRRNLNCKICCVDTWLGNLEFWTDQNDIGRYQSLACKSGYPSCYYQFLANVKHKRLQNYIIPFPQTSFIASKWFERTKYKPQLIYIDGSHETQDVVADIKAWWPLLDWGGIIFGDDWNWESVRNGVFAATAELGLKFEVRDEKWLIRKKKLDDIGYIIASHVNYQKPLENLLESFEKFKIPKEKIFLSCGGSPKDEFSEINGIRTSKCKHNSFDHTGSIEFCRHSFNLRDFPKHVILLHDTMELTENTESAVKRVNPEKTATSASLDMGGGMCNLMVLQASYLLSESQFLYSLMNCSKTTACETEGVLFKRVPNEQKSFFSNNKVDYIAASKFFGGVERIREFYHGPQLYKYKANWGQSNSNWVIGS